MARRQASPLLGARELGNLVTAARVIWKSPANPRLFCSRPLSRILRENRATWLNHADSGRRCHGKPSNAALVMHR